MAISFHIMQRHETQFILLQPGEDNRLGNQLGVLNRTWDGDGTWHFHGLHGWRAGFSRDVFDDVFDFEGELYKTARYNNRGETVEITITLRK